MTSGSILRGHLRSGGARTPPFLVIALLVVLAIVGFNYWNVSAEYESVVRELADLQDHLRIAVLKKDHSERQVDGLERRLRETEEMVGKGKVTNDQKEKELYKANAVLEKNANVIEKLKKDSADCQVMQAKLNTTVEGAAIYKEKINQLKQEQEDSNTEKLKLIAERQSLRLQLEELTVKLNSMLNIQNSVQEMQPQKRRDSKLKSPVSTVKQPPGQLPPVNPQKVRLDPKGWNGIKFIAGGPLLRNEPDSDDKPQPVEPQAERHADSFNNENNVIPPPGIPAGLPEKKDGEVRANAR